MNKLKKINLLYICSLCELLGISLMFWKSWVGIVLIVCAVLLKIVYLISLTLENRKYKICPTCKSSMPKDMRICGYCGHLYEKGVSVEALTGAIEEEQEEKSSTDIDCNFEKIEEIAVEEIVAFDGEIEQYLKEKNGKCKN